MNRTLSIIVTMYCLLVTAILIFAVGYYSAPKSKPVTTVRYMESYRPTVEYRYVAIEDISARCLARLLNGAVVYYDVMATDDNIYKYNLRYRYLGYGYVYSVNNTIQYGQPYYGYFYERHRE